MKLNCQANVCDTISVLEGPDKEASSLLTFPFMGARDCHQLAAGNVINVVLIAEKWYAKHQLYIAHARPGSARFEELYSVQRSPASTSTTSAFVWFPVIHSFHPAISSERMARSSLKYWSAFPFVTFSDCLVAAERVSEHPPITR